ncbi:hypothetical protein KKG22_02390 [Patescibacteria group bacterium]|nr:hypothetical protein [Patescibacteria group bacterium]MBU1721799.1 hypothetical protein [Patescibacteria group bacterium]
MKKYTLNKMIARLLAALIITLAIAMVFTLLNLENQQNMIVSFPWKCASGQPPCNPPATFIPWSNFFLIFIPVFIIQEVVITIYKKKIKK